MTGINWQRSTQNTRMKRRVLFMMLVLLALSALAFVPAEAFARSYTMGPVSIDATLNPDGSLHVVEDRTFNFDGEFNGVFWDLSREGAYGQDARISVNACGLVEEQGNFVPYSNSDSATTGTYQVESIDSCERVTIYSHHEDESAVIRIDYEVLGDAIRWSDTGELYWKFVSDGWDEPSQDVSCLIHLPVPTGQQIIAEENVRAWGHGALNGELSFEPNGILYTVPQVETEDFAEARISFPAEWLSQADPRDGQQLDRIKKEEAEWAEEANNQRRRAALLVQGSKLAAVLACLGSLWAGIVSTVRYRKSHKPKFSDRYFRDVPSSDHPAVLGCLYEHDTVKPEHLTASLMELSDLHHVGLEGIVSAKDAKKGINKASDYRVVRNTNKEYPQDSIDQATMLFLFNRAAEKATKLSHKTDDLATPDSLVFSDLKRLAKKYPEKYTKWWDEWKEEVSSQARKREFFNDPKAHGEGLSLFGALLLVAGIVLAGYLFMNDSDLLFVLLALGTVPIGGILLFLASRQKPLSEEAIELRAKLVALRRWLQEFTRLDEAIPDDVVLWNRLLVMSVALGVSDEVVQQLKVAKPELLESAEMSYTYGWLHESRPGVHAVNSFNEGHTKAASLSASEVASSSSSSSGGGGGGFSDGGGGGGGGGAF